MKTTEQTTTDKQLSTLNEEWKRRVQLECLRDLVRLEQHVGEFRADLQDRWGVKLEEPER